MVIGFIPQNRERAVELFRKEKAYHLVGEGELGQGEFRVGPFFHGVAESERSADDKETAFAARVHLFLHEFGKSFRSMFLPVFVQQDAEIRRRDAFHDELALAFGEFFRILYFGRRNFFHPKTGIVFQPLFVLFTQRFYFLVVGLGGTEQNEFHAPKVHNTK